MEQELIEVRAELAAVKAMMMVIAPIALQAGGVSPKGMQEIKNEMISIVSGADLNQHDPVEDENSRSSRIDAIERLFDTMSDLLKSRLETIIEGSA